MSWRAVPKLHLNYSNMHLLKGVDYSRFFRTQYRPKQRATGTWRANFYCQGTDVDLLCTLVPLSEYWTSLFIIPSRPWSIPSRQRRVPLAITLGPIVTSTVRQYK
jgi:hypothetical protein